MQKRYQISHNQISCVHHQVVGLLKIHSTLRYSTSMKFWFWILKLSLFGGVYHCVPSSNKISFTPQKYKNTWD